MSMGLTRRSVFHAAGAAGLGVLTLPALAQQQASNPQPAAEPRQPGDAEPDRNRPVYYFLNDHEVAFLTAAVDRLIPKDDWPSASEAGVVAYIDRQLASSYGAGARYYLAGPWDRGTEEQGYQLKFAPSELYRSGIRAMRDHLQTSFGDADLGNLPEAEQDTVLKAVEEGEIDLGEVPAEVFFEQLLQNTVEGYFADPMYGGNKNKAGWAMIGFPGAHASYAHLVERHGMELEVEPLGAADGLHPHSESEENEEHQH